MFTEPLVLELGERVTRDPFTWADFLHHGAGAAGTRVPQASEA